MSQQPAHKSIYKLAAVLFTLAAAWCLLPAQIGGSNVILSSAAISQPTFSAPAASTILTFTLGVTDARGLAAPSLAEVVVSVIQSYVRVYLPLLVRDYSPPITFPVRITDAIPVRPVAYQGEVFYVASLRMPSQLPPDGHFYFSSQQDALAPVVVDDALFILLDETEVSSYTFSTSSEPPEPAIVEVGRGTMEQLVGRTVTIEYRDVYDIVVAASEMWLVWMP